MIRRLVSSPRTHGVFAAVVAPAFMAGGFLTAQAIHTWGFGA